MNLLLFEAQQQECECGYNDDGTCKACIAAAVYSTGNTLKWKWLMKN